jgi:hypothetical protein
MILTIARFINYCSIAGLLLQKAASICGHHAAMLLASLFAGWRHLDRAANVTVLPHIQKS